MKQIIKTSKKVNDGRTRSDVLSAMMTEVGELAEEIRVQQGLSTKSGDDGVFGEAVDVILCAVDMIYVDNPDVTVKEIEKYIAIKLKKWMEKNG